MSYVSISRMKNTAASKKSAANWACASVQCRNQCIAAQFRIELPAGLGDPEEGKDYNFEEELLILHIQEESLFNRFLMESRSNDAVVNYKAVLTPTNAMWHPVQLKEQLAKEHEYMTQQAEQQKQQ